jgi:hypothetical protein
MVNLAILCTAFMGIQRVLLEELAQYKFAGFVLLIEPLAG